MSINYYASGRHAWVDTLSGEKLTVVSLDHIVQNISTESCFQRVTQWTLLSIPHFQKGRSQRPRVHNSTVLQNLEKRLEMLPNRVWSAPFSSVATIFGPPANNLFGPLAKGLRRLLLPGGPLAGPFNPAGPPRSRGLRGPRYATGAI